MKLEINHRCADFDSYRAARVKSLFNVDDGSRFDLTAELPIEDHRPAPIRARSDRHACVAG
jgi:hypothetical protein